MKIYNKTADITDHQLSKLLTKLNNDTSWTKTLCVSDHCMQWSKKTGGDRDSRHHIVTIGASYREHPATIRYSIHA